MTGFPGAPGLSDATFRKSLVGPVCAGPPRPPGNRPGRLKLKWWVASALRDASLNTSGLSSPAPPAATSPLPNSQLGHVVRYCCSSSQPLRAAVTVADSSLWVGAGSLRQRATISEEG